MTLEIGRVIAERYEITDKIGSGGMSIVYKALDRKLSRPVSLKVLREEYSVDEEFRKRFIREARSVASLNHQNIVNVYDVGHEDEINFIVMEYINGVTLKELIVKRAPFSDKEALGVAIQMTAALIHAHNSKIIHRDIKPQNVIVTDKGVIKVADFGIARKADSDSVTLGASTTLGSVHYFSPEQAKGTKTDPRSDLYSLGIVLYEMFSGELPFDADTAVSVALMQINEPLPDIHEANPDVSDKVKMIIGKLTEKNPDRRYQAAEVLLRDLRVVIANPDAELSFESEAPVSRLRPRHEEPADDVYDDYGDDEIYPHDGDTGEDDGYVRSDENDYGYDDDDSGDVYEDDLTPEPPPRRPAPSKTGKPSPPPRGGGKPAPRSGSHGRYTRHDDDRRDKVVVLAGVATALVLVTIAAILILPNLLRNMGFGEAVPTVITLPRMEGVNFEQLQRELSSQNIHINKQGEGYHETVPAGAIIESTHMEGEQVDAGTMINVTVSLGQFTVEVPRFTGREYADAYAIRDSNGPLELEDIYEFSDHPNSFIFNQEPRPGTLVPAGTAVTIFISKGQALETFTMPNLVGREITAARAEIERLGLRVGSVTPTFHAAIPKDQVMSQTIAAGFDAATGQVVNLVVSNGPEPAPEPIETPDAGTDITSTPDPAWTPGPAITPLPNITPDPNATPTQTLPPSTPPPNVIPTPTPGPYITPPVQTHALPTPTPIIIPPDEPLVIQGPQIEKFLFPLTIDDFAGKENINITVTVLENRVVNNVIEESLHVMQLPRSIEIECSTEARIQVHIEGFMVWQGSVTGLRQGR
ncbi:MAG: Stk1 family PASTA domain-containing Ser/Thr kinase [Defluviitaleaceae bacterium]|nr:Stk1 family PASTA domain-containing Ser/Thr kinase [Defluviitaleaceae bacterium]MCL2836149.1 Stk1 family PASTA domain-containing Ser/Thr kinase [Defluviitaleaceae bacterium]